MPEELSDYVNGIEKLTWGALTPNVQHHVHHEDNGNHNYLNKTYLNASSTVFEERNYTVEEEAAGNVIAEMDTTTQDRENVNDVEDGNESVGEKSRYSRNGRNSKEEIVKETSAKYPILEKCNSKTGI